MQPGYGNRKARSLMGDAEVVQQRDALTNLKARADARLWSEPGHAIPAVHVEAEAGSQTDARSKL